ncbi:hypothetical protein BJ165DRAFT_150939 [Panaeolus papilionaceus]|nr:hypothetical protein BJ165DRAFT_150939 [Panaeolus papilionaceus]
MLLLPISIFLCLDSALALINITIDETSSLIRYTPPSRWTHVDDTLAAGGAHMLSNSSLSQATITFIFLNMYYFTTRWNGPVEALIFVNGQPSSINMQDDTSTAPPDNTVQPTMASSVVWTYKGGIMDEREISIAGAHAVVDMIIFEVDDTPTSSLLTSPSAVGRNPGPSTSNPSDTSPTSSPTITPHRLSSPAKATLISLCVAGFVVFCLLIFLYYWLEVRTRLKKENQTGNVLPVAERPLGEDGKISGSPRASIRQVSNPPSNAGGEEPQQTVAAPQNTSQPTTAMVPPPEKQSRTVFRSS